MKLLRSILLLNFLVIFISTIAYSQIVPKRLNDEYYVKTDYYFGFCFITGANSSPVTFALVKIIEDEEIEAKVISKSTFVRMMSGKQECKANPENENFFEKYEIDPFVLEILWKLKYKEHPHLGNNQEGWAAELYSPSEGQFNLLSQYGIYSFTSYCYGENMFRLLKDIQSANWVNLYKSL